MPFEPNREELAWAAGFFDGEGSFSWTMPAAFGWAVINQTNRASLERFKRAVAGLGKIYGPTNRDTRTAGRVSRNGPSGLTVANTYKRSR
jgi:hypothetical protein